MRTYDWDAPAKLFFWPAGNGWDEEATYPTLADALQAAAEGEPSTAWIITQDGDIIPPRRIADLRAEMDSMPRGRGSIARAFLPWARAA
ncbi:hypothetical protein [Enterovirga sp. CN4-39]|uniref:hypothetical protein n=1 Tax=Enterovirga sp. CN4-39 TaxID=3400910 RepID=UPI003BFADF81